MSVFDRYMIKNLVIATVFVACTLSVIIFLTQSLRFLELVIEAGASSGAFWELTLLALPRFFEIIMPIALVASVLFVYSRMISDSELIVMRASGVSQYALARPAIVLSLVVTLFLIAMTMYAAPKSLRMMQEMRQVIKAQFSSVLFRDGVFNQAGSGLTVYIREKAANGDMLGIMIHDSRENSKNPSTIIAKRGVLVADEEGLEVLVFDGARLEYDPEKQILNRLNFERYKIDLPDSNPVRERWQEPEERTIFELINPDMSNERDVENLPEFRLEIHKRLISPFLSLLFTLIGCVFLLLGPFDRRGQGMRIAGAVFCVVVIQALYLSFFSLAKQNLAGLALMYFLVFAPSAACAFLISGLGEPFRREVLYKPTGGEGQP